MRGIRFSMCQETKKHLEQAMKKARLLGKLRLLQRCQAILAVGSGHPLSCVGSILNVSEETISSWVGQFITGGIKALSGKKSPGRPSKLTKSQKKELVQTIEDGPEKAGFLGACWRSPMIQDLIHRRYGVFYCVHYVVQLLKNLGLSYQKAAFTSDHHDPEKRKEWLTSTWPQILKLAKEKNALILFGDEASFPQWGTLTYTWAPKGKQPKVPTCGIRKSYKVFGFIDYFSGRFFAKGHVGRLNSDSYEAFLKEVIDAASRHVIIVQDGARYHTSKAMQRFFDANKERLTVCQLPSYSPDFNPIEKLWKEIKKDGTHMHYFPTFESLMDKVDTILDTFKLGSAKVLSLFGMYQELEAAA